MPVSTTERAMTAEERQYIRALLDRLPSRLAHFRQDAGPLSLAWVGMTAILVAAWFAVAWLVRATTGIDMGASRDAAPWVISAAAAATGVYLAMELTRSLRHRDTYRRSLMAELAGNRVVEELYEFSDALRMQEQEHGGLFYFLRGTNGRVLALYDAESQDIGVQGGDPLTSSFRPYSRLTMVRAPVTGLVIDKTFAGAPLDPGEPLDLLAPPDKWPVNDEEIGIPWEKLEATFCR